MGAPVNQVLDSCRAHLNDLQGQLWPDQKLIPFLQEAFRELTASLLSKGIPIINEVSAVITVPEMSVDDANLDLSTVEGYPTDMISPIWMKERCEGEMNADFVDMLEVDFIPNIDKTTQLLWWAWIEQTIMVLGALNPVQVQIRYRRYLTVPTTNLDDCIVTLGETFLSYRTGALAMRSTENYRKSDSLNGDANVNLDKLMRMNVKWGQNLPAKRRPYHRGRGRNRVLRDF